MKERHIKILLILTLIVFIAVPALSIAAGTAQKWILINPEGLVMVKPIQIAPRISTLEGKTVALRWNGKPNGDIYLNRIAALLTENVKDIKILKIWEIAPETAVISHDEGLSKEFAKKIKALKPDVVIASSAD
jgi:hypothetical protein